MTYCINSKYILCNYRCVVSPIGAAAYRNVGGTRDPFTSGVLRAAGGCGGCARTAGTDVKVRAVCNVEALPDVLCKEFPKVYDTFLQKLRRVTLSQSIGKTNSIFIFYGMHAKRSCVFFGICPNCKTTSPKQMTTNVRSVRNMFS